MGSRLFPLLFLCFLFIPFCLQSQNILKSLESRKAGEGTVTIHQDSRISALIGGGSASSSFSVSNETGESKVLKTSGYRVQVYAGNNSRKAREEAISRASQVKEYFPELSVYTHFSSPRWLCRVGDFKSIEEADSMMRRLKATNVFKEVSIVKEIINIPL